MLILDLFCGAGGASMGYNRAGYQVVGVDIAPQPNYPFPFHQGDAIDVLNVLLMGGKVDFVIGGNVISYSLEDFEAIHASPPCQSSSALTKGTNQGKVYTDFIPATRNLLNESGKPYIIENVNGADIRSDIVLCGEMFGLDVIRHRKFEMNWHCYAPPHVKHRGRVAGWRHGQYYDGPYVAPYGTGGGKGKLADWQRAMETPWMQTKKEIAESIPPAFTQWIGTQLTALVPAKDINS